MSVGWFVRRRWLSSSAMALIVSWLSVVGLAPDLRPAPPARFRFDIWERDSGARRPWLPPLSRGGRASCAGSRYCFARTTGISPPPAGDLVSAERGTRSGVPVFAHCGSELIRGEGPRNSCKALADVVGRAKPSTFTK